MRLLRASLVSLLLLCLLTSAVNAQSCPPLQGVQATLEGAQDFCRTSTGGTFTAAESGGGTSTHQWVYGTSSSGPWTPIAGATGTTYQLTGSDFPSTGMFWIAVTSTPQCGSPMTGGAQSVNIYDTLPAPDMYGDDQICGGAASTIAQSVAQWDSYSWTITHGTLVPGSNGCGDDPTGRCVSFRPDGTGDVHLSLTVTAGSCSSISRRNVPLAENAPPSLFVWTPVCPGGQGSAITSEFPTGVRAWSVTNAHIDADWGDHITFTADGNGPVDVTLTLTDANGCSSMSTGRANLAGTKPVITLGSPACATNGTATANGGWDSYQWSIINGTITSGQGSPNIVFSGDGGGPLTLTVTGVTFYGTFSCTTASDPVTVPTTPTPAITLATADICPYGTDTATAPEGYANYWWSLNNGYVMSGDGTNSIRFSRGGYSPGHENDPITVTLFVADANGCSSPRATATVPIRTILPPAITLETPDICPWGTNTATVPAQYAYYWWSLDNGYLMSGDGTNSIRFSRGGYSPGHENDPITITLYVQDADGCPAPQARVTVPIRAIDAPVITLGTPDICPWGTNTATVPAQYAYYWWSLDNGYLMSGDGTNSIRFSRGGFSSGHENDPITITLYVQDANGCPAPQARVTVPIRTIDAPVITLGTPDICKWGTNTATVPAQYAYYWWSLNNGFLMSGDGTNSITFSAGGGMPGGNNDPITITLYVQDANGCPAPQATVTVPIRTIDAPVITLAAPDICKWGTNTATVPAQYAYYWWSLNNGSLISGEGTNSITFSAGSGLPNGNSDPVTITLFVQDGNGCPAPQSTVTVPIRNIPPPTITLATPDVCLHGSDTASVPAQYANYSWSISGGFITGGSTQSNSITFTPDSMNPGPMTLSLYVTDGNGCPAPQSTVTVPIRNIPPPTITLATPDVCPLGSDSASVPAQYANYSWSITNGNLTGGQNTNNITFTPLNDTDPVTLSVSVQDANGCPVSSAPVTIPIGTIAPPPITLGADALCPGSIGTASVPASFASYTWSVTNGTILGDNTTNAISFRADGSSNSVVVHVSAQDDSSSCPAQNSVTLPIRTLAPPVIALGTGSCPTTASVTNASDYTQFQWSADNAEISSSTFESSVTFHAWQNGHVTLTVVVYDGAGCQATSSVGYDVTGLPDINMSLPGVPYCYGSAATASVPDGGPGVTYQWSLNSGRFLGSSTSPTVTFIPEADTLALTVTATNAQGCSASGTSYILVNRPPVGDFNSVPAYVCANGTATISTYANGVSYDWQVIDGEIVSGAGTSAITFRAHNAATVTVRLTKTGQYSCGATYERIIPVTFVDATINPSGPTTICTGGSVTLTASSGASYLWSTGATTPAITVNSAGNYSVTVTNANGCSATSAPVHVMAATPSALVITTLHDTTCLYGSIQATISNPSLFSNITWSAAGGSIFPNGASSWTEADNGTVSQVSVTAHATDVATGCQVSSTVVIPIVPLNPPVMTVSSNGPICYETPVTISIPPQPAGSEIIWDYTGVKLGGGNGQPFITLSAPPTPSFSLRVRLTDPRFCATQNTITVPVHFPVVPVLQADDRYGCAYTEKTVTVTNPSAYTSYTWSVTNGTIIGPNNQPTVHIGLMGPGVNTDVLFTASDGTCPIYGSAGFYSSQPTASISGGIGTYCTGTTVWLSAVTDATSATYLWSNGATSSAITITAVAPGPYTVTVTNEHGCSTTSAPRTVQFAPQSTTVNASGATTFCAGGSVALTPAMFGDSYLWSNGATTRTINVTQSGAYSVTVTSASCQYVSPARTVTVNPLPAATITTGGPTTFCAGGSVTLTASAGSTYSWSNGATTQSITVTAGGSYSVTVTNANSCSATSAPTVVTVNANPAASITASGPTTFCAGGSVTLTASSAASYLWSNGATTQSIVASTSGNYSVTVTNGNGCSTTSAPTAVTVNANPTATITASGPTTFCTGGNVTLTASSAASYLWSTGATTASIIASTSGNYSVTVTNGNGCSATSAPTAVTVNANPAAAITASGPTTFCTGGSVTLTASSGTSYLWSNGATTASIVASTTGNYSVTVTNGNGCSATSTATAITVNANPTATITPSGPTTFCTGGNVTLTASSAASYLWSTGATTQSIVASTSGNYSVTVTNGNGCSATSATTVVTVNANPAATITASGPTSFCAGGNVTLTASSGASYLWSTGATTASIVASSTGNYSVTVTTAVGCSATSQPLAVTVNTLPDATITAPSSVCASTYGDNARVTSVFGGSYAWTITGGTITGGAGTYQIAFKPSGSDPVSLGVTVTNASGCAASSTRVVDVHSVPKPAVTPSGAASFCNSGVLTAPAGYTAYSWKRDGGQIGGASASTFVATQSGTYSVIVWDATNCWVESDPVSITVSTTPVASISAQNNVCAGTTYGAVSAGTAASYQWSVTNGTIVDGQGTNVIHYTSGASGNVTLTLTVANAQGCSDTQSVNIPIANVQAAITPSGPLTICPGGSVTLTASAGASYIWSNNTYAQSTTVTQAGSYSVRVFDAAGCYAQSQSVTVSVASPSATITPSGPTTFCAGGSVTLSAPAGYSYTWSTGATTQSITVSQSNTYSVTVLDANGCTASSSATVTVRPLPTAAVSGGGAICAGGSTTIMATLTGTAPFTVTWSDNVTQTINSGTSASRSVNPAATTTYTITSLTDANCTGTSSGSATVTVRPLPTAAVSGGGAICAGGSTTITAALTGTAPWTVTWSDNVTQTINSGTTASRSVSPSATTTYTITSLTDANCTGTSSGSATVTVRSLPTAVVSGGGAICPGGSAMFSAALTGTAPFTLIWSDNVTQTISSGTTAWRYIGLVATQTFTVTSLTDANCTGTSSGSATVTVNPLPTATVSGTAAICPGGSTTITATLTGTAPWNVTWSDNVTQTINTGTTASRSVPASATTYTVTSLTDANCTGTSSGSATITVKTLPTATVSGGSTICPGNSSTITATLTGTAPWSVTWSDNVTQTINSGTTASRAVSPAATTIYTVTSVSDAASCPRAGSGSATVTVKTLPTATVSGDAALCPGASATITAALTGTAPWSVRWSDNVTQTINTGTTATRTVNPSAATTYTVTSISDASGCAAVAGSGSATVTRSVAASITTQPANKSTTINTPVTISVVAAGTSPISYQWFKANGTIITGATSSSYTTSFPAKGNNQFYVEVWNACNTTHVKSHNVTITVN